MPMMTTSPFGGDPEAGGTTVIVLGRFGFTRGPREVCLPAALERLLIYLALEPVPRRRPQVAGTLWPDICEQRAMGNLRTVLWRLSSTLGATAVVATDADRLLLARGVNVDLYRCLDYVNTIRAGQPVPPEAVSLLSAELLPDRYEDWIVFARERHRQLRLHALEHLCRRATEEGDYDRAIEVGLLAVACEPTRATSQIALIRAHLAEGNVTEAHRQLAIYRKSLIDAGLGHVSTEPVEALITTAL
jgi:DNA-binding SARP family transcriptional activator